MWFQASNASWLSLKASFLTLWSPGSSSGIETKSSDLHFFNNIAATLNLMCWKSMLWFFYLTFSSSAPSWRCSSNQVHLLSGELWTTTTPCTHNNNHHHNHHNQHSQSQETMWSWMQRDCNQQPLASLPVLAVSGLLKVHSVSFLWLLMGWNVRCRKKTHDR